MQLGIFAKTFSGRNAADVLSQVKAAGFATAQYNLACSGLASMPDEVPDGVIAEIKQAVAGSGVSLCALSATYNMIHPDAVERSAGHKRLAVVAGVAKDLRIPFITLCTGTCDREDQWRAHPNNDSKQAWRDLLESMALAVRIAEDHNIDLGIEPELANVVNSSRKAAQLIGEMQSPRIKIVLDPANLFEVVSIIEQRRLIDEAFDLLAPHLVMAHAKDRRADGTFTAAGQGVLDYPHFLRKLMRSGFNGPLITHGLSVAEASTVATFLKQQIAPG